MSLAVSRAAQLGLPDGFASLVGIAGTVVLLLMLVAMGAFVYKSLTGGVDWPDEEEEPDEDGLSKGKTDDEWDYY